MAKRAARLAKLTLDELIALRKNVDRSISERVAAERRDLQSRMDALAALTGADIAPGPGRRPARKSLRSVRSNSLKGKKVTPKYRGPGGETWAGRGLAPRWLAELEKKGKKREGFLIKP
jgi:DNA-binding protein H-NS